jgi:hypothetical protein
MSPPLAAQRREQLLAEANAHHATRGVGSRALVLQRRLHAPFQRLRLLLTHPSAASILRAAPALKFDEPFALAGTPSFPIVRSRATLIGPGPKQFDRVAIEIGPWSRTAGSDLQLRPHARHPERWSHRRTSRYFAHAHQAADELTELLQFATLLTGAPRLRVDR